MNDWQKTVWGDLISLEYGKPVADKQSQGGPVPVFGTNGAIGSSFEAPICPIPSFIIGRKGAYRGVHYSPIPFSVIDTAFYALPRSQELDLKWAYYKFLTYDINGMDSGSAIPSTDRYEIYRLTLSLPPLPTQRRIAAVLSALDDKIELNNRINANLEAQAQALFRSWFVDFEPWGGTMPEGWREGTLEEICHYSTQRVPCEKATVDNYISTESMRPNKQGIETASSLPATGTVTVVEARSVLVSNIRPYFKKIFKPEDPCLCSQDVLCFVPKKTEFEMLLFETLWDDAFFTFVMQGTKGTKMPRGDKEQIMQYRVAIPASDTLEQFNEPVVPMLAKVSHNRKENRTLSALRDTLLPKLMSGEIDVSQVEIPA